MSCAAAAARQRVLLLALLLVAGIVGYTSKGLAGAAAASSDSGYPREVELYCNVTGPCRRCSTQHMQSDSCHSTGFSKKMICWVDAPERNATWQETATQRLFQEPKGPVKTHRSCKIKVGDAEGRPLDAASASSAPAAPEERSIEADEEEQEGSKIAISTSVGEDGTSSPGNDQDSSSTMPGSEKEDLEEMDAGTGADASSAAVAADPRSRVVTRDLGYGERGLATGHFVLLMFAGAAASLPVVVYRKRLLFKL